MKAQKTIISIICIICFLSSPAQNVDKYKNEISVNATGFVANYFNLGGVSSNTPYIIDYRRKLGNHLYFRSGLDGSISRSNRAQQNNFTRTYLSSQRFDIRLGVEKRKNIAPKWQWTYGLDIFGGINYTKSENTQQFIDDSFSPVTVKRINSQQISQLGFGPVTGIHWKVSQRIALWTETRLYFSYLESNNRNSWDDVTDGVRNRNYGFNFDPVSQTNYSSNTEFFIPLDLFVSFKF